MGGLLEFVVQALQFGHFGVAGRAAHGPRCIGFQQRQQLVNLAQVLFGYFGDVGAAAYLHGHQAFGCQHLDRLAQRRAADAQLLGDLELVDPAAGWQFAVEDALAQQLGHFFVEGAWGQGDGRHDAKGWERLS